MNTFARAVGACGLLVFVCGCPENGARISTSAGQAVVRPPARRGAVGRPQGTVRAGRLRQTVIIEIAVCDIPKDVAIVSVGFKLRDGTVLRPRTIGVLAGPAGDLGEAPAVCFSFSKGAARSAAARRPAFRWKLTYELAHPSTSVAGSTFSVVLGDPEGEPAMRMGISAAVSTRDGSPMLCEPVTLVEGGEQAGRSDALHLPPARAELPTARFVFTERAPQSEAGRIVCLAPVLAAASAGP